METPHTIWALKKLISQKDEDEDEEGKSSSIYDKARHKVVIDAPIKVGITLEHKLVSKFHTTCQDQVVWQVVGGTQNSRRIDQQTKWKITNSMSTLHLNQKP